MSKESHNNGSKIVPEISFKQKENYKAAGKWPPPKGITILREEEPEKTAVIEFLSKLSRIAKPSQRKFIEQAKEKLIELP